MGKKIILALLDHVESYICQFLLAFFTLIIFMQVIFRALGIPLFWTEEVARFSFVWFVFFGASFAARLSAHNRVLIQFKLFKPIVGDIFMLIADAIWLFFNYIMVWKGYQEVMFLKEFPYASPALNWQLWAVYLIFPISFTLMSIRIIQVNVLKFILKVELVDPDKAEIENSKATLAETN